MMRRFLFLFLVLSLGSRLLGGIDWSSLEERRGFYLGAAADIGFAGQDDTLNNVVPSWTFSDNSRGFGGDLGFGYAHKMLRFENKLGFYWLKSHKLTIDSVTHNLDSKERVVTDLSYVYLDIPLHERWMPYVGVGLGIDIKNRSVSFPGMEVPNLNSNAVCGALGVGVGYKYSEHVTLTCGYDVLKEFVDGGQVLQSIHLGMNYFL